MLAPLIEAPRVGLRRTMLIKMAAALGSIAMLGSLYTYALASGSALFLAVVWAVTIGGVIAYAPIGPGVVAHNWGQWQKQQERKRRRG